MKRLPKKDYFRMRLAEAIKMGNTRKAKYFRSRLEQLTKSESHPRNESAKESALRKCRNAFKGLDEAGRLKEANRMFTIACNDGHSVNSVMAFLKEANVMSDTELIHAMTF